MASKKMVDKKTAVQKGPAAELILKRLEEAGILNRDATLGDIMKQISAIERDMGTLGFVILFDSDKWCFVLA